MPAVMRRPGVCIGQGYRPMRDREEARSGGCTWALDTPYQRAIIRILPENLLRCRAITVSAGVVIVMLATIRVMGGALMILMGMF